MLTYFYKKAILVPFLISMHITTCAQVISEKSIKEANSITNRLLESYFENETISGFAVSVGHKGKVVYSKGFGFADTEQQVPVTKLTRFRLASVSKLFTAACIAKLSEEGRLDLDASIQKYVPDFPEKKWPITTRQIAAHIGGIRGYRGKDFEPGNDIHHRKFKNTDEALEIFSKDSLIFKPGTKYKYSTFGFTLLTSIIESITNKTYENYLTEEILTPLEIESIEPDRPEKLIPNRSRFYQPLKNNSLEHASPIRSDFKFGGGGLLGSAEDLVRFGNAHVNPGFFKSNTMNNDLFVEQARTDGRSVNIGLAWRIGIDKNFGKVYHHSGSLPGGRSVLMIWPDYELVIAYTSNTTNTPYYAEQFAQVLSHIFLTTINGAMSKNKKNFKEEYQLYFMDRKEAIVLELNQKTFGGSMQTPPSIAKELIKRKYPVPEFLKVVTFYLNGDSALSVILASDIGLHRIEINAVNDNSFKGFVEELANKFEWQIKQHVFVETK